MLDEPFSALDTNLKRELIELLQKRIDNYSGLTLYVTHNIDQAYQLCPQLLIIDRGKAIAFNRRQEMMIQPPNVLTAQITGCRNFSEAKKIAPQTIRALDWQCDLKCDRVIPDNIAKVAIRSPRITFVETNEGINVFAAWIANQIKLPNRVTLYLKLHSPPNNSNYYHLEMQITLNEWQQLPTCADSYWVQLLPSQIIMFQV